MPVCGQDFYDFATKAITFGDEIAYRNAIARAYYAMYHEVLGKVRISHMAREHLLVTH